MDDGRFRRTVPTVNLVVVRSQWRLMVVLLLAIPAVLLAVDMLVSHRWVPTPTTYGAVVGSTVDENGNTVDVTVPVLTVDGKAQRRRDLAFGSVLLLGGVATMAYAVGGLVRPSPLLRATDEGISVRVDGRGRPPRLLPWESIVEVRSGVRDDEGADLPVLSIHLDDPAMVPFDPAGGVSDPPWLHLWADDWDHPAHQIAPLLDPRARRAARPDRS
jgi:hypothetical protein